MDVSFDDTAPIDDSKPFFSVLMGPETGRRILITQKRMTIGRGKDRDIRFNDRAMSRKHCEIDVLPGEVVVIRDCGSQNGIRINGRVTMEQRLHDGDQIDIGSTRLVFNQRKNDKQ